MTLGYRFFEDMWRAGEAKPSAAARPDPVTGTGTSSTGDLELDASSAPTSPRSAIGAGRRPA